MSYSIYSYSNIFRKTKAFFFNVRTLQSQLCKKQKNNKNINLSPFWYHDGWKFWRSVCEAVIYIMQLKKYIETFLFIFLLYVIK